MKWYLLAVLGVLVIAGVGLWWRYERLADDANMPRETLEVGRDVQLIGSVHGMNRSVLSDGTVLYQLVGRVDSAPEVLGQRRRLWLRVERGALDIRMSVIVGAEDGSVWLGQMDGGGFATGSFAKGTTSELDRQLEIGDRLFVQFGLEPVEASADTAEWYEQQLAAYDGLARAVEQGDEGYEWRAVWSVPVWEVGVYD